MFKRRYRPYLVHLKGSRLLLALAILFGLFFAASNALVDRPVDAPALPAGTTVSVYLLENGGNA